MKKVNIAIFGAFFLTGAAFLVGLHLDLGRLVPAASFTGWFLCAYSGIAYLVASSLYASRSGNNFWLTLYPANFGLALFAVAMFTIRDERTLVLMATFCAVGAALSYLGYRTRLLTHRFTPIGILLLLVLLMFIEPISGALKYIIVGTGALMLTTSLLAFVGLRRITPSRASHL